MERKTITDGPGQSKKLKEKKLGGVVTYPVSSREASNTRREMNDISTRIVRYTPVVQEASPPQAECTHRV